MKLRTSTVKLKKNNPISTTVGLAIILFNIFLMEEEIYKELKKLKFTRKTLNRSIHLGCTGAHTIDPV
ncbi:hypothetical protein CHUAL_007932 [Chamberlinius hualienensis]